MSGVQQCAEQEHGHGVHRKTLMYCTLHHALCQRCKIIKYDYNSITKHGISSRSWVWVVCGYKYVTENVSVSVLLWHVTRDTWHVTRDVLMCNSAHCPLGSGSLSPRHTSGLCHVDKHILRRVFLHSFPTKYDPVWYRQVMSPSSERYLQHNTG